MKNEMFQMLKIYEQDFPEQMSNVTETEVIAHYCQMLQEINDKEINDNIFPTLLYDLIKIQ